MNANMVKPGAIGQPFSRVDERLKVTGEATFAAEYKIANLAHGVLVLSRIARGTIKRIDTSAAEREPGIITVLTHENAPRMRTAKVFGSGSEDSGAASSNLRYLNTNEVYFNGQPVAVVVAETLEQAEHAVTLVVVEYEEAEAKLWLHREKPNALVPEQILGEPAEINRVRRKTGFVANFS